MESSFINKDLKCEGTSNCRGQRKLFTCGIRLQGATKDRQHFGKFLIIFLVMNFGM
jgi:hypothetical protein